MLKLAVRVRFDVTLVIVRGLVAVVVKPGPVQFTKV
jgi:hypothetical protein